MVEVAVLCTSQTLNASFRLFSDPYGDPIKDEKAVKSELLVEKQDMKRLRLVEYRYVPSSLSMLNFSYLMIGLIHLLR